MTEEYTHYLVLSVKDLKALLSYAEKTAKKVDEMKTNKTRGWTTDMHSVVVRFNESTKYEGQLQPATVSSGVSHNTINEVRRGVF